MAERTYDVTCSKCHEPIYDDQFGTDEIVDRKVYRMGELKCILLFHATCIDPEG